MGFWQVFLTLGVRKSPCAHSYGAAEGERGGSIPLPAHTTQGFGATPPAPGGAACMAALPERPFSPIHAGHVRICPVTTVHASHPGLHACPEGAGHRHGRWGRARAAHRGRAGLGASGSKTPPHKPCGKWSKTQPLLAPWSMALGCLCWSSKQLTAWAVFGVQDVTPALGHLLALTDTRPCAPPGSSAKDGRARLSLLLRANYPPISLGKDSVDVCKISIH